jgi:hypothetical protein
MIRSQPTNGRRVRRSRRGVLTMELILTLPILGIILFGIVEFSILFIARGAVVEASRAGARVASLPGADAAVVEDEIRKVIEPRMQDSLQVEVDLGQNTGDVVSVIVKVAAEEASPDLLWPIGFSLRGEQLIAETRMIRE